MRDKKKSGRKKTPEQEALEKHVDAMMDPKLPDEAPTASIPETPVEDPIIKAVMAPAEPSDTDTPKTAPTLAARKSGKKIAVSDAAAEPLKIDNLDEQIKSMADPDDAKKPKKPSKSKAKPAKEESEAEEASGEARPEDEEDIADQGMDLDDAETDKAVDEIVAYEGDVMLAVADSTAAERNREFQTQEAKGHPILSTFVWTLVTLMVVLIIALIVLLVMGDNLAGKLGL
jgi:hypothetical protein